jgi:hypothetical protein
MPRLIILALMLGASIPPALAQTGQFPGVAAPAPPQVMPGPTLPGAAAAPRVVVPVAPVPSRAPVLVPGAPPGRDSFSDRVGRCMAAGAAAGIGPNALGPFTSQCAQ